MATSVRPQSSYQDDLDRLAASTNVLLAGLDGLTDEQARADSLLPGWTRGHVLTHIARNADAMLNLVAWVRTGEPTPMYPSVQERDADIDAGAGRPAAVLVADVRDSAARLQDGLRSLTERDRVSREVVLGVVNPESRSTPADKLPLHRRNEVEVHHTDLDLGYTPGDWPREYAERLAGSRSRMRGGADGLAGIGTLEADEGPVWVLAMPPREDLPTLSGPACWLAAWLMGRTVPPGLLRTSDGSLVPPAPPL